MVSCRKLQTELQYLAQHITLPYPFHSSTLAQPLQLPMPPRARPKSHQDSRCHTFHLKLHQMAPMHSQAEWTDYDTGYQKTGRIGGLSSDTYGWRFGFVGWRGRRRGTLRNEGSDGEMS